MVTNERLNVLVIMSDEQRWDTLGYTGNPAAHTPHLDALAEESTNFDRCYTPFPLCCPSRSSLWTGRMPRHHHVLGNWRGINPELRDTSLATDFKQAGYHTIYNGKWHVPGTTPQRMGFDDCTAIPAVLNGQDRGRYIEPYRDYVVDNGYDLVEGHIENLTPDDLERWRSARRGTADIQLEHYLEPWQTSQFLQSLDNRPEDKPWFAATSFNAPHFPMIVPAPYDQLIDRAKVHLPESFATGLVTKPKEVAESNFATKYADLDEDGWIDMIAHYLGMCALVDAQVGAIVQHLEATDQLDRTIIVYTSDHGDMMGSHRLMEKGHLLHYEESLRVPLLVRHPDALTATTTRNLVSVVDMAQTLSDLAGIERDEDDGRSFAAMVGDPAATPTRDAVTAETVLYEMDSENAHGEHVDPATWDAATDSINLSVRTDSIRYVYRSRDVDELYDHRSDPHEQSNLAADPTYDGERKEARRLLAAEVQDVFPQVANTLEVVE